MKTTLNARLSFLVIFGPVVALSVLALAVDPAFAWGTLGWAALWALAMLASAVSDAKKAKPKAEAGEPGPPSWTWGDPARKEQS
jgi:hypothetical protein